MLCSSNSPARLWNILSIAPFVAAYPVLSARGRAMPAPDETPMMFPDFCCFIVGITSRVIRKTAVMFTAIMLYQASLLISVIDTPG